MIKIKHRGFTLIEVLITLAIIGVLAGISYTLINPVHEIKKANDSRRKTDLAKLQAGLELFYGDQSSYPSSGNFPAGLTSGQTNYIDNIPKDPKTDEDYEYVAFPAACDEFGVNPPCTSYQLYACLENVNDPNSDENKGNPDQVCPAGKVSFTVLSP
jgi:type IV pilus assembly protein PilE